MCHRVECLRQGRHSESKCGHPGDTDASLSTLAALGKTVDSALQFVLTQEEAWTSLVPKDTVISSVG